MNGVDFGKILSDASAWLSQNVFSGPFGEALMTFLKAFGNLLMKILEFMISVFQYLINLIGQLIAR